MPLINCKHGSCAKPSVSRGWCYGHYRRWLKYGDPNFTIKSTWDNPKYCTIDKCTKSLRARGLCKTHYNRLIENGDPFYVPQKWEVLGDLAGSGAHTSYRAMMDRCYRVNSSSYSEYGGRGIRVCESWRDSFLSFYEDMGDRPEGMSLERIDNNGNYTPLNCRWATRYEQSINKRTTKYVKYRGEKLPLIELAKKHNIPVNVLRDRIYILGWTVERSLAKTVSLRRFNDEDVSDMRAFREAGMQYKDIARAYNTDGRYISHLVRGLR